MALTKGRKVEILDKAKSAVKDAASVVFVSFKGLSVSDSTSRRSDLRESASRYLVIKKTLLRKALEEQGIEGEMPELPGETAIAYGSDEVMPAKSIAKFGKEHEDAVEIVGGVFENKFMNQSEMKELASIPGQDQLMGMFVNVINSPIQGFVIALDAIAQNKE